LDSISGGVGPYFTEWFLGGKSVKVGPLLTGVKANQTDVEYYKVLLRDFNGCTLKDSIHLNQPTKLEGQLYVISPIKCYDSLGTIGVSVKGGVKNPNRFMGYDFYWNGSRNPGKNILSGIQAGTQRVMVYDSNGCVIQLSMDLKEPQKLIGTIDSAVNVLCFGDRNGRIYASAKGGLKDYRFYWTDTFNRTIGEGLKLDGIGAGQYKLVVKDRNGCTDSVKNWIEVLQPEPISLSLLERMNITCFNGNNGKLRVAASGGNGGYSYSWRVDPVPLLDSLIENLSSGKYSVDVTDIKGCRFESSFTISNPNRNPIAVINDSLEVCNLDTMKMSAKMNLARYFEWKFQGQILFGSRDSNFIIPNVQKYDEGKYTVIGTDELGCKDSTDIVVRINDLPSVNLTSNPPVACLGSSCNLEATGAKKYHWFKERFFPVYGFDTLVGNNNVYTINPVGGSDVGRYMVLGESVQGCKNVSFVTLNVGLDSISVPNDTQVCAGNNLVLRAKGAVDYEWTAPSGSKVKSPSFLVTPVSSLDSGNYKLTVTDRWNCRGNFTINVMVNPKPKVSIFDVLNSNHCEGSDVELIGNTDAITMDWIGPNYRKIGTSQNVQVIPSVTIKDQGDYKLIGYSIYGCMDSSTTFVKVNPLPIADFGFTHNCPPNPIAGEDVNFYTTSLKASKYEYYLDNQLVTKEAGFKTKFITPGSYVVKMKAFNEFGCSKEVSKAIIVEDPWKLWVPNAFTPNNDRLNSEFKPVTLNVPNYKMFIYDRWGGKIFEGENSSWDGKILGQPAPIGVYAVIIEHNTICSDDKTILDKSVKTEVTVIR
jgi:gliding motility-associated-like protein